MALGNKNTIKADHFQPIKNNVFVTDIEGGSLTVTAGGIIRTDDNGKDRGIRPRWGRIWAIGPDVYDIEVGEWVFIEHARWTNAIDLALPNGKVRVWKIDWPNAVLLATQDDPRERRLEDLPLAQHPGLATNSIRSVAPNIIRKREY